MDKTFTKAEIRRELDGILSKLTFADTIARNATISEIVAFDSDVTIIKSEIQEIFGMSIVYDVSNMTVNELFTTIYGFICDSGRIKSNATKGRGLFQNENVKWNRRLIFSAVMNRFKYALGRTVSATESLDNIKYEISGDIMGGKARKLNLAITDLEKFFDIKINDDMRIYNIANAAEESMIKNGKIQPKQSSPDTSLEDKLWQEIIRVLPVNFLESLMKRNFNANIPGYKLAGTANFEEFVEKIRTAQEKNKAHQMNKSK